MLMASAHRRLASGLARRAGLRLFRFFRRALEPARPATVPRGLEMRMLSAADLGPLCHRPELDLRPERVAAAYERGDLCAGAYASGELAGYCWFAFAPVPHLDAVWVDFHRQGVWMYKSLVLPSQRGRGVAPALYRFTDRMCAERGRTFSISCIESHNGASIAAIRRTGYAPSGYGGYLSRGRKALPFMSPSAKTMAVRFFIPAGDPSR
jgi:GNAT superfamily N-acetyltransferase